MLQDIVDTISSRCAAHGLDLAAVTSVGAYNDTIDADYHLPGPPLGAVVVIGNTRAIWPHIEAFVRAHPDHTDPVDAHVEAALGDAVNGLPGIVDVRLSHEPPPRRIAIQQLAHVAGLAFLAPSHLCVHPEFGPWMALRAAVVLEVPAPTDGATSMAAPCDCASGCAPFLEAAIAASETVDSESVRATWRRWVEMRDACPVGRQWRYDEDQIAYHYAGVRPPRWTIDGVGPPDETGPRRS